MPGTFTNVWDDTFPPDTEFAYLYAQNLRSFRTDIQQRMASISGLDGSKPSFYNDETTPPTGAPTKWNGLLFFATDTGRIYQFQYPVPPLPPPAPLSNAWVDVTLNFVPHTLRDSTVHGPVSSTIQIYGFNFGPLSPTQRMRITVNYTEQAAVTGGGGCVVNISDLGGANQKNIMGRGVFQAPSAATHTIIIEGGNVADAASQYWTWSDIGVPLATPAPQHTTQNTAVGGSFEVDWLSGQSGQSATFYGAMVEFL